MKYSINPVHYGIQTRYRVTSMDDGNTIISEWVFDSKEEAVNMLTKLEENELTADYKMMQKSITELNFDGNEDRGRYGEDESRNAEKNR